MANEASDPPGDTSPDGRVPADLFPSLVGEADEGVVVMDEQRVVRYANPAAEFLLGLRAADLVGEMFGLPLLAGAKPTRVNVVSADGRTRVAEVAIEPVRRPGEKILVLRLRDVTAYHEDVARAREEVRRRDEFLAMLSHELRNPLAAIQTAGLLLSRAGASPADRERAASIFERQFAHLTRLLDDLLDVARVSHGQIELRPERTDLVQVVRDAVAALDGAVAKRGHALAVELPAGAVWVWGDPTRLGQVAANLLGNAAKFTPPGGHLGVSVTVSDGHTELAVWDDGPGIPADLLPRVFEPFVQGGQGVARDAGGLGLGLALADAIVRLHGGTIAVRDNRPGATFVVRLACLEADPADAPAGRPLRVLVVEDQDDSRRALADLLRLDGYDVVEAADGPAGLAALADAGLDLALIDIGLPGLDGYEVARRAPPGGAHLVALTGYGAAADVRAARDAGFAAHLTKPIRSADLARVLAEARARRDAGAGG